MKENFYDWMKNVALKSNGEKYDENTIHHYISGIDTIKRECKIDFWTINIDQLFNKRSDVYSNIEFIKKDNRGGKMYTCALKKYIDFIIDFNNSKVNDDIKDIKNNKNISYDLKDKYIEVLYDIRNPQFQKHFRKELIKEFKCKCALCNINDERLLIASHIIPYSECQDKSDMYEPYNGLLLCADHDCLFDKHLITFDNEGKIVISESIDCGLYDFLNIDKTMELDFEYLSDNRKRCLQSHFKRFKTTKKSVDKR